MVDGLGQGRKEGEASAYFGLKVGPENFDRIKIGGIRRQKKQGTPRILDELLGLFGLMKGGVIHDHNLPWSQLWHKELLDPHVEKRCIASACKAKWHKDFAAAFCSYKALLGVALTRNFSVDTLSSPRPSIGSMQIRIDTAFIYINKIFFAIRRYALQEYAACCLISFFVQICLFFRVIFSFLNATPTCLKMLGSFFQCCFGVRLHMGFQLFGVNLLPLPLGRRIF